ncbi:MAG: 1-acyl-sn-glycerol-3-phosphate acyltransferase [Pirellulales bacterium]|nr:1-acyl-sn-glycerol-3-phosphate acyltransferase [Pirellulales bacterium]
MNRQPFQTPPRTWEPRLNHTWLRLWRPLRRRRQRRMQRLVSVDVQGAEHVRQALAQGHGTLITPNHAGHADCYALYGAADAVGSPFYCMVAWQVFARSDWLTQRVLQNHGCFSVDREGADLGAFRRAVDVLRSCREPLVVFPEGEVYHLNDRVTPFREGPAAMALTAARKADRPVTCIPCAIKYRYVDDPMPALLALADELEQALYWRPRPDLSLPERIYRLAEGALALKELEHLGTTQSGSLPERVANLIQAILDRLDGQYDTDTSAMTVPERIKTLRHAAIQRWESHEEGDPQRASAGHDLDDLFLVVQAFSYPGNYVSEHPTVERLAETLDKFEEDILGLTTARIRGRRTATVTFGPPIPVPADRSAKGAAATLTRTLEEQVQALLDRNGTTAGPACPEQE